MVTVADLKDQTGKPGPHPILVCYCCGAECSANAGDYFNSRPTFKFVCCGEPMDLAIKRTVYDPVISG